MGRLSWRIRTLSCLRRACRMQRIGPYRAHDSALRGNAVAACPAPRSTASRHGARRRAMSAVTLRCHRPSPRLHEHPRYRQDRARTGGTSSRCPWRPYEDSPVMCWAGGGQLAMIARHSISASCVTKSPQASRRCTHDALTMYSLATVRWLSMSNEM